MGKLYGYIKKDSDKYAKIDEITTDSGSGGITDMGVPTAPTLTPITTEINFLQINNNKFYNSIGTEYSLNSHVDSQTGVINASFNNIQYDNGEYGIGLGLYIYYKDGVTEQQKQQHYESLSRTYVNGFITNNGTGDVTHTVYKTKTEYNSDVNTYHLVTTLNYSSVDLFTNSIQQGSLKLSSNIIDLGTDTLVDDIFIDIIQVRLNPLVKTISNSNDDNVGIIGVINNDVARASEVEKRFDIAVDTLDNTKINLKLRNGTINDRLNQNIPSNTTLLYTLY